MLFRSQDKLPHALRTSTPRDPASQPFATSHRSSRFRRPQQDVHPASHDALLPFDVFDQSVLPDRTALNLYLLCERILLLLALGANLAETVRSSSSFLWRV